MIYHFDMSRFSSRKSSLFLALILLTMTSLSSNTMVADSPLIITEKPYFTLTRAWEDLSLLYDNYYHNSTEVDEEIDRFHSLVPELVDVEVIGQSYLGKDIRVLKITNEERTYQKAKAFVCAQHHGREQISTETALRFIAYLLNNYQENQTITDFIDYQEIYVIPTVNPDALDIVVDQGDYWLRKNLRPWDDDSDGLFEEDHIEDVDLDGVVSSFDVYDNTNPANPLYLYTFYEGIDNDGDGEINEDKIGYTDLNRNYDSFWRDGSGWENDTQSQVYPGPTPFSEPETQAVRDFMLQHRFGMAYSLHSGINATFFADNEYGWAEPSLYWQMVLDYSEILPPSYTEIYLDPAKTPFTREEPSYALAGGWDTWAYFERDILAPITFELYRNLSSILPDAETVIVNNSTHLILEWTEIYGYFTPEDNYINALWNDVRPGFDYLLQNTPRLNLDLNISYLGKPEDGEVQINVTCENLSPRIKTMDRIYVQDANGSVISSYNMFAAGYSAIFNPTANLGNLAISEGEYPITIGNEYVGYREYLISIITETLDTNSGFTIGLSILGVSIISLSLRKMSRKKR